MKLTPILILAMGFISFPIQASTLNFFKWKKDVETKLTPLVRTFDSLDDDDESSYKLKRIDFEFSVSADIGILLFSKEKTKGVELVWERPKESITINPSEIDVSIEATPEKTADVIIPELLKVIGEKASSSELRKDIIKIVYEDAIKIHLLAEVIASTNNGKTWYVQNIFKVYNFGVGGNLGFIGLNYDKRLRFRFKLPLLYRSDFKLTRSQKRIARRIIRQSKQLERISANDTPLNEFVLKRVRSSHQIDSGVSIGLFDVDLGKGVLLEWLLDPESPQVPVDNQRFVNMRRMANFFETHTPESDSFKLSQIRLKSSSEFGVNFLFFSLNKSRDVEYHYRRRQ